jgi:uncharacterized protein
MSFLTRRSFARGATAVCAALLVADPAMAQTAPSAAETAAYTGLHRAAALGDAAQIRALLGNGADPNARDSAGRTPLHVAAFGSHYDAVRALVAGGGDINALERSRKAKAILISRNRAGFAVGPR